MNTNEYEEALSSTETQAEPVTALDKRQLCEGLAEKPDAPAQELILSITESNGSGRLSRWGWLSTSSARRWILA